MSADRYMGWALSCTNMVIITSRCFPTGVLMLWSSGRSGSPDNVKVFLCNMFHEKATVCRVSHFLESWNSPIIKVICHVSTCDFTKTIENVNWLVVNIYLKWELYFKFYILVFSEFFLLLPTQTQSVTLFRIFLQKLHILISSSCVIQMYLSSEFNYKSHKYRKL